MRPSIYSFLVFSLLCSCHTVDTDVTPDQIEPTLQEILQLALDDSFEQVPGASLTVIAPELDLHWTGSAGFDSEERERKLSADQPFRIASVTKTFVAAAMLRLHETGRLNLEDPIDSYLQEEHRKLLLDHHYPTDSITWRQCLNQTSGLYDYAMGGRTFAELITNNPQRVWTRTEQIALAMESGQATGSPGERYSYGDTGYILAGATLEAITDTNLGVALRQLLHYDQLGMSSTWLERIEDGPAVHPPFVNRYFQRYNTTEWDPSMDLYGGGGLISTTDDLATFTHALFNEQIFKQTTTLDLMLQAPEYAPTYLPEDDERFKDYRLGLWRISIFGEDAFMHGGLWGTGILHVPAYNCTVAVNYTKGRWDRLLKQVVLVIKNAHENQ